MGPVRDVPTLPGLQIVRVIGRGGDADVYLAQQESLDRMVAVKVLRHGVDDAASWRAFQREARAIGRLSGHAHVVTVYDAGRSPESGHPYLVTEFLERGSLGDVIAEEGALPPLRVAEIGAAIAEALDTAHSLDIHHRDVKPGNVLIGADGRVKLGDFGIARLLSARSVATTDLFAFTPEHVAPEVLRREPDGPWSDLYGLASTLSTALLGDPPLRRMDGERIETYLARKVMAPPPRLPDWVPPSLADPITRALDPSPDRRPSVPEFRRAMEMSAGTLREEVPAAGVVAARTSQPSGSRGTPARLDALRQLGRHHDEAPDRDRRRRWLPWLSASAAVVAAVALVLLALALAANDRGDGLRSLGVDPATSEPVVSAPIQTTLATAPSSTASPTTTAASTTTTPTTAPPTTIAPATTVAPVVVVAQPVADPSTISQPEAERFIRTYFDEVEVGDYQSSWSSLTPDFQTGKARSYAYYTSFWDENDIEVGDIRLITSDDAQATLHVDLRWNGAGDWLTDEFVLRRSDTGELLISAQSAVGR